MNVYDFDKTIYRGDSTVDFYLFCLKRQPGLIRFLPKQSFAAFRYALGLISKKTWKEAFFCFLPGISISETVSAFWQAKQTNIYPWYLSQKEPDDVIISASPEFLLLPICAELSIAHLIASRVRPDGSFDGENCRGEEKRRRFHAELPGAQIEQFYSDSMSDLPMAQLSRQAFLVKKGVCIPWNKAPK